VHPEGGKACPDNGTKLLLYQGYSYEGRADALTFTAVEVREGQFKLQHKSGKFVHPDGGSARPVNGTKLVLHEGGFSGVGGEEALTFEAVDDRGGGGKFKLQHSSGKFVHPDGGRAAPSNGTHLVLHDGSFSNVGGEDALTFKRCYR